jgi:hypothetical protein
MAKPENDTVTFDAQGDILLHVGIDKKPLLVSSKALSLASPVFKAMFDGRFAEGQNLSPDSPRVLQLLDDAPTPMMTLCSIAHMNTVDLKFAPNPVALADLAVLCDKYNCAEAVRGWCQLWVLQLTSQIGVPGYGKLILVTYMFDMPEEFHKVTQKWLCDYSCGSTVFHGDHFVPSKVFGRLFLSLSFTLNFLRIDGVLDFLSLAQKHYQNKVLAAFNPSALEYIRKDFCPDYGPLLAGLMLNLAWVDLWPLKIHSISQYRTKVLRMGSVLLQSKCTWSECSCKRYRPLVDIREKVLCGLDGVIDSIQGLCLDCIKSEVYGEKDQACRFKHDPYEF